MNQQQHTAMGTARYETAASREDRDIRLETRIDRSGTLTYHSLSHDTTGGVLEKVYNHENHLLKVIKRSGSSRLETFIDPRSGQRTRVNELATMPDGNLISSDIVYYEDNRWSQVVTIFKQDGLLVRIVERESRGSMVTYQGQTDYDVYGAPSTTVNQHTDSETGLLMHREQIHWMSEGLRAMTEHYYFDVSGRTVRYAKTIHHSDGGIFSEEIQEFDSRSQKLVRRELSAFDAAGRQTCVDSLSYDTNGQVSERQSTFFDGDGHAIASRQLNSPDVPQR